MVYYFAFGTRYQTITEKSFIDAHWQFYLILETREDIFVGKSFYCMN